MEKMNSKENIKIDFVGIGAVKSGTTWIAECLEEHPQISLPRKDQEKSAFFLRFPLTEKDIYYFEKLFPSPSKLKGDFHVAYLQNPKTAEKIKKHNPEIKIIVCLRNPVKMAWSQFRFLKFLKNRKWDNLREAVREEPAIIEYGFHQKYLQKYFDLFSRENILVLIYEDIEKDPLRFIQNIYSFLGVDPFFSPPSIHKKVNLTNFKMSWLGRLLHKGLIKPLLKHSSWAWKAKKSPFLKKIIFSFSEFYSSKGKFNSSLSENDCQWLMKIYKKDIEELENLINRNLKEWKKIC